jgi:hypothetical protein
MDDVYHMHHIKPRHAGGSDDPSNLIRLTIEEHALAHKKLWDEIGNKLDFVAWQSLTKQINSEEARLSALRAVCATKEHRQKLNKPKSNTSNMKGRENGFKKGNVPHNKDKSVDEWLSIESRKRISEANKGNNFASGSRSESTKEKMRGPRSPLSDDRKKQISDSAKLAWIKRKQKI